jgi:hypothetical protein
LSDYQSGKILAKDALKKAAPEIATLIGVSRTNTKDLTGTFNDFIGDKKVYGKRDWFDELLIQSEQNPEDLANQIAKDERNKYRTNVEDNIRNQAIDNGKPKTEDEVKKDTETWFRKKGYYKKSGDKYNYEDLMKQEQWKELENNVDNMENEDLSALSVKQGIRKNKISNNRTTRKKIRK